MAVTRAKELQSHDLMPVEDLQTAVTDDKTAAAQVVGADALVEQAKSAVQSAEVNLAKTVIESPIDGVVTSRNVDVGQTVSRELLGADAVS